MRFICTLSVAVSLSFIGFAQANSIAGGNVNELFQMVELQNAMKTETNSVLWAAYAEKLRRLYLINGMFLESYEISKIMFTHYGTVASGVEVVYVCLAFRQTNEALSFIKCLESRFAHDSDALITISVTKCNVLLAAGKTETARGLVREIYSDSVKTPEILLQLAKVQAATRQHASSVKSLIRCFELTPPSVLSIVKTDVRNSPEFKPIASTTQFRAAMNTQSKQPENCCFNTRTPSTNTGKIVFVNRL